MIDKKNTRLKAALKNDTFIQGVLLLLMVFTLGLALFLGKEYAIFGLMILPFLGIWQVGSAIIMGIALGDFKKRGLYLISVLGFFISCFISGSSEILRKFYFNNPKT